MTLLLTVLLAPFLNYRSNFRHRPIGIGVQGLADAFQLMKIPFDSPEARQLNRDIFETIYFGACQSSCELAARDGAYETYEGSPMSKGQFQFDMWGVTPTNRWDWATLREQVKEHGMRNSLLVAPMPTASTAQILGNNESTEPFTSNMYNRRVLAGEFTVVNKHLLRELTSRDLWTESVRNRIIADNGSVQNVPEIPEDVRQVYKTVWEIPQRSILEMAADRSPFICQSQSLNVHIADPNSKKLTSMHFFAWQSKFLLDNLNHFFVCVMKRVGVSFKLLLFLLRGTQDRNVLLAHPSQGRRYQIHR